MTDVYRALDDAVGTLVRAAGPDCEITIVSDHGSGPSSDKVVYLNRALAEAGLLTFRAQRGTAVLAHAVKQAGLRLLSPPMRQRLFRVGGSVLPNALESRARFGLIDMKRTRAFSDELNYFPAIHLNLAGREPLGVVKPEMKMATILEVQAALSALRDPDTGARIVKNVWPREELYDGPFIERAPDLVLELHLTDGLSYNLMPTSGAPPLTGPIRRLGDEELLGRKGRSLPGSHRPRGLFIGSGPRVSAVGQIDSHIADAAATVLCRAGVEVPSDLMGRVLFEMLEEEPERRIETLPEPATTRSAAHRGGPLSRGQDLLYSRLRALGYVE